MGTTAPPPVVRFATFELDLRAGELHKAGARVRLQDKPFRLLAALLERPGELVTREELCGRLWPSDTFVDFDNSLNNAVNRVRAALGDAADHPRFVETVGRHGYRFIAPVETQPAAHPGSAPSAPGDGSRPGPAADGRRRPGSARAAAGRGGRLAGLALPSAVRRPHPLAGRAPLRQPVRRCGRRSTWPTASPTR